MQCAASYNMHTRSDYHSSAWNFLNIDLLGSSMQTSLCICFTSLLTDHGATRPLAFRRRSNVDSKERSICPGWQQGVFVRWASTGRQQNNDNDMIDEWCRKGNGTPHKCVPAHYYHACHQRKCCTTHTHTHETHRQPHTFTQSDIDSFLWNQMAAAQSSRVPVKTVWSETRGYVASNAWFYFLTNFAALSDEMRALAK